MAIKKIQKNINSPVFNVTRESIENTKYYKSLTKMMQILILKRFNFLQIHNGYNVSKNIGFEAWVSQSKPRYVVKEIVNELINKK